MIRLTLAVLLGIGGLVLAVAGPSFACSCAMASTKDYVQGADVIVTGTLAELQDPPQQQVMSSTDPVTYTVTVDRVFKGDAGSEVEFTSAVSGASCGLEGMTADRRYTFFLNEGADGLTASLCGGTAPARGGLEKQVIRWTGPAATPAAAPSPPARSPAAPTTPAVESADAGTPSRSPAPWLLATAAGAVLAGVGLWRWRRRATSP